MYLLSNIRVEADPWYSLMVRNAWPGSAMARKLLVFHGVDSLLTLSVRGGSRCHRLFPVARQQETCRSLPQQSTSLIEIEKVDCEQRARTAVEAIMPGTRKTRIKIWTGWGSHRVFIPYPTRACHLNCRSSFTLPLRDCPLYAYRSPKILLAHSWLPESDRNDPSYEEGVSSGTACVPHIYAEPATLPTITIGTIARGADPSIIVLYCSFFSSRAVRAGAACFRRRRSYVLCVAGYCSLVGERKQGIASFLRYTVGRFVRCNKS